MRSLRSYFGSAGQSRGKSPPRSSLLDCQWQSVVSSATLSKFAPRTKRLTALSHTLIFFRHGSRGLPLKIPTLYSALLKLFFSISRKYFNVPTLISSVAASSATRTAFLCICKLLTVHIWEIPSSTACFSAVALL